MAMASSLPSRMSFEPPRSLSPDPLAPDDDLRLKLQTATGTQRRVASSLTLLLLLVSIAGLAVSEKEEAFCTVLNAFILVTCVPVLLSCFTASPRLMAAALTFVSLSIALSVAYVAVLFTTHEAEWNSALQIVAFVLLMLIAASVYDARQWIVREQEARRINEAQASVPLADAEAPSALAPSAQVQMARLQPSGPSSASASWATPSRVLLRQPSGSVSKGGALVQAVEIQGPPSRPRSPSLGRLADASSSSASSSSSSSSSMV